MHTFTTDRNSWEKIYSIVCRSVIGTSTYIEDRLALIKGSSWIIYCIVFDFLWGHEQILLCTSLLSFSHARATTILREKKSLADGDTWKKRNCFSNRSSSNNPMTFSSEFRQKIFIYATGLRQRSKFSITNQWKLVQSRYGYLSLDETINIRKSGKFTAVFFNYFVSVLWHCVWRIR